MSNDISQNEAMQIAMKFCGYRERSKKEVEYRHRFLIDFGLIFGPFFVSKSSVPKRFWKGFE